MKKKKVIKRLNRWVEYHSEMAQMFDGSWTGIGGSHYSVVYYLKQMINKLNVGINSPDDACPVYEFELTHRPPKIVKRKRYL